MRRKSDRLDIIMLTPDKAMELLEHNTMNRPLSDAHMHRIAGQIIGDKWLFNGDTIKISEDGAVVDGQHRLWACIEAKKSIETAIVYGVPRVAFATVDTLRRPRSGGDVLALNGCARYRNIVASALQWLTRWQTGEIANWRDPLFRVENSDVERQWNEHPGMLRAVTRANVVKAIGNPAVIGFFYYVLANRAPDLAERMIATLAEPGDASVNDPFFQLRRYFLAEHHKRKDPMLSIAVMVKAANAAHRGEKVSVLNWRSQGERAEAFPTLRV